MGNRLIVGDNHTALKSLGMNSAHVCVTSPPYWGKRAYTDDEHEHGIGSLDDWVIDVATTFDLVRDALTPDGLLWVVIDDTAVGSGGAGGDYNAGGSKAKATKYRQGDAGKRPDQSLAGAPFALEAEMMARGWVLRSRIVWVKESRPGAVNLSVESIKHVRRPKHGYEVVQMWAPSMGYVFRDDVAGDRCGDVWFGPTAARDRADGYTAKAPFPEWLVERCLRLSCTMAKGETVLDPYAGACTTLKVAEQLGLDAIGVDLDEDSVRAAQVRLVNCEVVRL